MLNLDPEEHLIDWDFLARCAVDFDSEHMPADASTAESYGDYVMGVYGGIEKMTEWASSICGTPVDKIELYARILSKDNNVSIHTCGAPARSTGSENFPQTIVTVAAMGGRFGKSGNGCADDQQLQLTLFICKMRYIAANYNGKCR